MRIHPHHRPVSPYDGLFTSKIHHEKAILIQKRFRGAVGRKKATHAKHQAHVSKLQKRYETQESIFIFYFEQQGAAMRIQSWWHKLPMGQRYLLDQKNKKLKKYHDAKAKLIQKNARAYIAREFFKVERVEGPKRKVNKFVTKLQAIVRFFLVRCRMPERIRLRITFVNDGGRNWRRVRTIIYRKRLHVADAKTKSTSGFVGSSGKKMVHGNYTNRMRRIGIFYPSLRVGNEENHRVLAGFATKIQQAWKKHLTRRFNETQKELKREMAVMTIAQWWFEYKKIRLEHWAMLKIQRVWKIGLVVKREKHRSATKVQSLVRLVLSRKMYLISKSLKMEGSVTLQKWTRKMLDRRRRRGKLRFMRSDYEMRDSGATLCKYSERLQKYDHLWRGVYKVRKSEPARELLHLFNQVSSSGLIDFSRIFRLFKELKGFYDKQAGVNVNLMELTFAKVKTQDKRIEYNEFVEFLYSVAAFKFTGVALGSSVSHDEHGDHAPAKDGKEAKDHSKGGAPPIIVYPGANEVTENFAYGRLRGKAAIVTKFIDVFLSTLSEYGKTVQALKKQSTSHRVVDLLHSATRKIQWFLRKKVLRMRAFRATEAKRKAALRIARERSAIQMQAIIRGYLARHEVMRIAQIKFVKYIDSGKQKQEFWFNPKTKQSFWSKPRFLLHLDCGAAAQLPKADEEFSAICGLCAVRTAVYYCDECDDAMCHQCFINIHKGGSRKSHAPLHNPTCIQCDFQVGTKQCHQCDDAYCDTCFRYMHRKGRLRLHTFKWTCKACENCHDRAAQWESSPPEDNYQSTFYCTVCAKEKFGKPKQAPFVRKMKHIPFNVLDIRKAKQDAIDKKVMEETYALKQAEMKERRREAAALTIQRVYRGHVNRIQTKAFLELRHQFLDLRVLDQPYRNSVLYQLLEYFGYAPLLKSDTPLEKAKHLFPGYMHATVTSCIEGKWSLGCQHIHAVEKHKLTSGEITRTAVMVKLFGVWRARSAVSSAARHTAKKRQLEELHSTNYQNARAISTTSDATKKMLYDIQTGSKELLEEAIKLEKEAEEDLKEAELSYDDVAGPRGFPRLISLRRQQGILMPFKVTATRGSELFLAKWDAPPARSKSIMYTASAVSRRNGRRMPMSGSVGSGSTAECAEQTTALWRTKLNPNDIVKIRGSYFTITHKEDPVVEEPEPVPTKTVDVGDDSSLVSGLTEAKGGAKNKDEGDKDKHHDKHGKHHDKHDHKHVKDKHHDKHGHHHDKHGKHHDKHHKDDKHHHHKDDKHHRHKHKKGKKKGGRKHQEDDTISEMGDDAASEQEEEDFDIDDDDDDDAASVDLGLVPVVDTVEHFSTDRPWVLDTCEMLEVYRVTHKPFFSRTAYNISRVLHGIYFVQKIVAVCSIMLHKIGRLNEVIANGLDEDGSMSSWFRSKGQSFFASRDNWHRASYTVVHMSFDFTARRHFTKGLIRTGNGLLGMARMMRSLVKRRTKEAAQDKAESTPYARWNLSLEKSTVICMLEVDKQRPQLLGEFQMDVNAPVDIMREYVQRAFRDKLNPICGDSFLFFAVLASNGKETVLERRKEPSSYSHIWAPFIMDAKTMIGGATATIVREPNTKTKIIPAFVDLGKKDEEDGDDALSTATGDDTLR